MIMLHMVLEQASCNCRTWLVRPQGSAGHVHAKHGPGAGIRHLQDLVSPTPGTCRTWSYECMFFRHHTESVQALPYVQITARRRMQGLSQKNVWSLMHHICASQRDMSCRACHNSFLCTLTNFTICLRSLNGEPCQMAMFLKLHFTGPLPFAKIPHW